MLFCGMRPLASLTAGNVAATEGLAQLIGEHGFSALLHEGKNENLHVSVVSTKVILLVIFKTAATAISLGAGFGGGVFSPSLFMGAMLGGVKVFLIRCFRAALVSVLMSWMALAQAAA